MTSLGTFDRTAKHSTARPSHITSVYSFLVAHHLLLLLLFDWSVPLVGHHHRWGCKKQQQRFWQVQQYLCPLCRCWRVFVLLLSRCQVIANCVLLTISAILSSKEKTLGRICCSWALWVSLIQVCFQEYHEEVQRGGKYCTAYRMIGWVGLQVIERVVVTRFAAATFSSHAYWMMMFLFRQTHLILLIGYSSLPEQSSEHSLLFCSSNRERSHDLASAISLASFNLNMRTEHWGTEDQVGKTYVVSHLFPDGT